MKLIHFAQLPQYKARKRGSHCALFYRDHSLGKWCGMTWTELEQSIRQAANSLAALGIEEHTNIGICSPNKPHCIIADFANFANRAVSVPMHATLSEAQMRYIVAEAEIPLIFVGNQQQFDYACAVKQDTTCLQHIVAFDESIDLHQEPGAKHFSEFLHLGEEESNASIVEKRQKHAKEGDLAIILYTSGTTGEPKGVMITHEQLLEAVNINHKHFPTIGNKDKAVSFLPLSHIFERIFIYLSLNVDTKIYLNEHPADIQQIVKEVRPTIMCNVPRYWEKVAIGAQTRFSQMSAIRKGILAWAMDIGRQYNLNYKHLGKRAPLSLAILYRWANRFVFCKLKKRIGIENGKMFPVAGAAASNRLILFFRTMGVPLFYGYGLTETCATVSVFGYTNYEVGSVGEVVDGVEVKIGDDNEILVKGKTVTAGYYKKPEATKQAFVDGWFRTGDVGKLVDGRLYMTDRLKDLFKTSNGKYIAPQQIETQLSTDPYIEQVAVIANERNYVTAIIAPNLQLLQQLANERHIRYERIEDLLENEELHDFYAQRIASLQTDMAEYEKIKRFRFIKQGFSIESGEMTNTLKLRRAVIMQHYKLLIDEMYDKHSTH